ncbi:16S rRNA (uracil(1498)-N(3))-methyltransferase [Anaerobacillus sp. MEB173]|uniref:16S rRNA (uracil(1498)-N(3))-methyltransferase n=1 Tax=Anaerobacillus sp. MEB173 TaxID=3383345 RepID=UPI003F92056D
MQRYFVTKENMTDSSVLITGEDVNHIARVMRMQVGDEIICSDNERRTAICQIISIDSDSVSAKVMKWESNNSELPIAVTIAQGMPKGDKLEYVVQKGTELGAVQFIPFAAARSIVKWDQKKAVKKIERIQKIAKEAAEQSHRERIPFITVPMDVQQLLDKSQSFDVKIVAYEEQAKAGEMQQLAKAFAKLNRGSSLLVVIGPEGGLTEDEVKTLEEHGFLSCSFGPRILRTETAALYVLSALSYQFELMNEVN